MHKNTNIHSTTRNNSGSQGRIRPHERDTNDSVPITGEDIEVTENHKESVRTTLSNDRERVTRRNYRNRVKEICMFLRQNYHTYCDAGGTRELISEEQRNPELYHHNNTVDLKYEGMNIKLILAFFATKKRNPPMARRAHSRVFTSTTMQFFTELKKLKQDSRQIILKKGRNS